MTPERKEEIREAFEQTPEPERNTEDVAIGELLVALDERDEKLNRQVDEYVRIYKRIDGWWQSHERSREAVGGAEGQRGG